MKSIIVMRCIWGRFLGHSTLRLFITRLICEISKLLLQPQHVRQQETDGDEGRTCTWQPFVSVFMQMFVFLLANHHILVKDKSSTDWFEIWKDLCTRTVALVPGLG